MQHFFGEIEFLQTARLWSIFVIFHIADERIKLEFDGVERTAPGGKLPDFNQKNQIIQELCRVCFCKY